MHVAADPVTRATIDVLQASAKPTASVSGADWNWLGCARLAWVALVAVAAAVAAHAATGGLVLEGCAGVTGAVAMFATLRGLGWAPRVPAVFD